MGAGQLLASAIFNFNSVDICDWFLQYTAALDSHVVIVSVIGLQSGRDT